MKCKRLTVLLLSLVMCLGLIGSASAAIPKRADQFPDFNSKMWYAEAVTTAVENGLLIGTDEGLLKPNGNLTRAEMAAVINRAFGAYKTTDISEFTDVKRSAWHYEDIQMAVQMGTYEGNGNGTMTPDNPISRQEIMAVVCRALQLDTEDYEDTDLSRFPDAGEVAQWALPYVKALVGAGYVQGRDTGLAPTDSITRAEFAQLFHNIIKEYVTEPGTHTGDRSGNLLVRTDDVTLQDMTIDGDLIIGCGAADGKVTLSNVTVTGRVVVWGGGTEAVYMNDGTSVKELVVCRLDGPVKVIFDRDSTLTVYDTIEVRITSRAKAFEETEVIFYDITQILAEQENMNDQMADREIKVTVDADLFAVVGELEVIGTLENHSKTDTYTIELRRNDTGELVAAPIELVPRSYVESFELKEGLPMREYPCTATVTAMRDGQTVGTVEIAVVLHVAYLWAL